MHRHRASAVPVTTGSPSFRTVSASGCAVSIVWFPSAAVLDTHFHERPTFAVILDGGFDLRLSGAGLRRSHVACPAGTILTQPAGQRHANHFAGRGARGVVLEPDLGAAGLPQRCVRLFDGVHHFRDGPIAVHARRMERELIAPDELTPLVLHGLILEMFAEAARLHSVRDLRPCELTPSLHDALEFIHAHFRENLRIGDIANAAQIDAARLAAAFRALHRMPIGCYVRRLRHEWAADQIATTMQPIARIAVEAGYADQAHLTRAFRRATGTTPAAYRRQFRRRLV